MSVSVVVATYGGQEWVNLAEDRAIPSTFGQGAQEVITHHDDQGTVSSSRNAGASLALSEWLLFVDADDEFAPGFVGAMERALEQAGANGKRSLFTPAVSIVRNGRGSVAQFFKEVDLRYANWLVVGTLVHRDLFWEVGGFDDLPHGFEDWSLWSKCARLDADVVKVPAAVYRYWANPQSAHRQGWRDKKWQRETHHRVALELDEWEAARA